VERRAGLRPTAGKVERRPFRDLVLHCRLLVAVAAEKVPEHMEVRAVGEQGQRGPVPVLLMRLKVRAEIRNTKAPRTPEMPPVDLARAEAPVVLRPTVATRNTAEVVARLAEMSARRVRPEALVSLEPVAVAERVALNREVKTAEPVALGNLIPRGAAVRAELRARVRPEQVGILAAVMAVAGVMVPAELAVPAEYLVAERAAAVATPESRAVWAPAVR
jgi:hypothetical protein